MRVIRIHETGGADRLKLEELPVPVPKAGEVRFRAEACGVNFVDIYRRVGLYPGPLPATLGLEASGAITAIGPGVAGLRIGQRVATAAAAGAYAEEVIAPAAQVVSVPAGLDGKTAAAVMLQGLTAHYLACSTYPLKSGDTALVHAAAGGVGLLLVQIAKLRGAHVIGTAGSDEKAALARSAGADEAIVYTRENFAAAVGRLTAGRGVDVVYDSVGKDTFEGSLDCLRSRGMLVSFGNASGAVPAFSPLLLSQKGSLYLTRPNLGHYTRTPDELLGRANELFRWIEQDRLRIRIGATFPLAAAADAHRALEGRQTTGKVLLVP
ncbi:MAG: quinone oxidoreductase family protein [Opitutaceae bacterium]